MSHHDPDSEAPVRIDIWLWAARMFRTRSLAKQAIDGGKIELNGQHCKPARTLSVGDRLRVTRGEERLELVVVQLAATRGSATIAQGLYQETEASVALRAQRQEQRRLQGPGPAAAGRPDKRSRRQLRQFKSAIED